MRVVPDFDAMLFGEESFKERVLSVVEPITPLGCSGHFDWLRKGKRIIGVRLWPFADNEVDVLEMVKTLSSDWKTMRVEDGKWVALGFGEGWQEFDEDNSQDQDMGDCGLLKLQDESLAFYFDANELFNGSDCVKVTS